MLMCPECRQPLDPPTGEPARCGCGRVYPRLEAGGLDFLQGREFADFTLDPADQCLREVLENESAGIAWRMENFILPLIRRYTHKPGNGKEAISVLDCGCGNGLSIDILQAHGLRAVGIDAGRARHQQWSSRTCRSNMYSADALRLPFADKSFDAVLSSGLIEHIGIHEEITDRYRSWRLKDCHARRQQFIRELARTLKPNGFILLDHPNGSFPADFWHGREAGSIRWHLPFGDMLPSYSEVCAYFRAANPDLQLRSLSPVHRLRFHQVSGKWYGRLFTPAVHAWLKAMNAHGLGFLARSFLNPYLVTLASRAHRDNTMRQFTA
jgi:SAM-dependent methyltransferase